MLPRNDPDRTQITFDDHRLVANAGLILPATLALHLGLPQLALFASYSYHGCITDRDVETLELEADHHRHAEIENAIRDLKYGVGLNHLPSGRFAANSAWLAVQVMAHNLVWYVGMRQTDPTWVEENRGPAWSSHPILIEPEQLPGPIAPSLDCEPCHFRPDGTAGD